MKEAIAQEATWLRLLLTVLGLFTPSEQFAEIHIHENNKCAEAIQPISAQAQDGLIPTKNQPSSAQPRQKPLSRLREIIAHVRKKIIEAKNAEIYSWHQDRNVTRERRNQTFYVPRLKFGIHHVLGRAPKKYASRFFQLKVGHAAIGVFLERIGVAETAECWWCQQAGQSVLHLYTECRKWRRERRVLRKELKTSGVAWQRRPEKRWVASLLANERAIQPLLKYLMTTEVGGREGGAEREADWEKRADREGGELLDSR